MEVIRKLMTQKEGTLNLSLLIIFNNFFNNFYCEQKDENRIKYLVESQDLSNITNVTVPLYTFFLYVEGNIDEC